MPELTPKVTNNFIEREMNFVNVADLNLKQESEESKGKNIILFEINSSSMLIYII